jgi:outer membrane protein assembly factor BamE (lipoprotein component of BamABCDE complex)
MQPTRSLAARLCLAIALAQGLAGCSVYMAANQPDKKDVGVLRVGTPRSAILAELGTPIETSVRNGARVDIFTFTQGYSSAEKGARAVLHGAADVLTLGLWEVAGTPIEGYASGTKVSVEITYDREERVVKVAPLRGQEVLAEAQ